MNRKKQFWKKFEDSIKEVIELALDILGQKDTLPKKEDDLNRVFYDCLCEANFKLQNIGKGWQTPPVYEARNQPDLKSLVQEKREHKRPDFQWIISDNTEIDYKKSSKQFVLECKRLGTPLGSRIFNQEYIHNGVKRFVTEEHGYARGVESSAMLGYIQSMEIFDILSEVNFCASQIQQEQLSQIETTELTVFLTHEVKLEYSDDKLRLEHIWVDLKKFY